MTVYRNIKAMFLKFRQKCNCDFQIEWREANKPSFSSNLVQFFIAIFGFLHSSGGHGNAATSRFEMNLGFKKKKKLHPLHCCLPVYIKVWKVKFKKVKFQANKYSRWWHVWFYLSNLMAAAAEYQDYLSSDYMFLTSSGIIFTLLH